VEIKNVGVSLKNKVVFITGASVGIGAATALAFAREGARLLLCSRRVEKLRELEPKLMEAGAAEVFSFDLDVQDRDDVEGTFATLPDAWSEVEVLVNNAGLSRGLTKLWEDDVENWEEMIDTNIKGLLYVTRAVVPGMVQRGRGHVINLGSTAGHLVYPGGHVYCATKAAERFISDGLRVDLNGTPVRVTSIDPGMVKTDFSSVRFRGDEERASKVYAGVDALTPGDIADTIVWAATRPPHVMIQTVVMTCTEQANAYVLARKS
jgi:3-hydroxy acid dehydrogenase/malonic semialdehyde reductase